MAQIYLVSFIISLILSAVFTRCIRDTALARGWITTPSSHHIHRRPVPRLGGIAIYFSFVVVAVIMICASAIWKLGIEIELRTFLCILIPGTLIFLLGLYDDIYSVNPRVKFAVQTVAALMLYYFGIGKFGLPEVLGFHGLEWLSLPMTVVWVLWITNAFNLIDGLDGLAAGSSLFSTLTLFAVSLISGKGTVAPFALVMAGATLGFLRFNFNPATIFLGDCGSLFLGFMLSALALAASEKTPTIVAVALPIVSFGVPLLETSLSVVRRFLSGRPLFGADREHMHHKLLERGLSQRQAVVILYGASALCGLLSLFLLQPGSGVMAIVLLTLGAVVWMGVKRLGYHEFDELGRVAQRTIDQKRIISNNLAVRRAANKLAEAKSLLQVCSVLQEAFEANDFDGYQLSLARSCDRKPTTSELALVAHERKDQQHYVWHKPVENEIDEPSLAPRWMLTFELETENNQRCGCFSLYRTSSARPLMVDLNLLTSEFNVALADAVVRLTINSRPSAEKAEAHASVSAFGGERVSQLGFETA
jgi:UDP-GlcNAc:undecaprenyl-phosphate GlcNAc-1-phosphate transferase